MFKKNQGFQSRAIWTWLLLLVLAVGMIGCANQEEGDFSRTQGTATPPNVLSEVAAPAVIRELRQNLEQYQPQVQILSPQPGQILESTTAEVKLQVQDFPIFQNQDLQMGPHLHLILDNEPYRAIYDVENRVVLEDLAPGTHTLRVFASRPWHESFKNEGAYAQTSFYVYTKTDQNNPNQSLPLLTYSRPKGTYGAEPIMLDFYLTNTPLHLVAQENPEDNISDWRIRATVNGQSFLLDNWQPVYLEGFKNGENWVQLEFLDQQGNKLSNIFNDTARIITYEPDGQDTLSKLVRGELSAQAARAIVDPGYQEPVITPTQEEIPALEEPVPSEVPTEEPLLEEPVPSEVPAEPIPSELTTEPELPAEKPIETERSLPSATSESFEETEAFPPQSEIVPAPEPAPVLPEVIAPESEAIQPQLIEPQPELDAQESAETTLEQSPEADTKDLDSLGDEFSSITMPTTGEAP